MVSTGNVSLISVTKQKIECDEYSEIWRKCTWSWKFEDNILSH